MREKTGNTGKLKYDFDDSKSCEINYKKDKWVRVSPREFRSFGGLRRILNIEDPSNPFYESYNGPVYYFMTNKLVEGKTENVFYYLGGIDPRDQHRNWR